MNKLNILVIALAIGFGYSASGMAEGISKNAYKANKDKISAEYKMDKSGCASLSGNASDICIAEAKGKEDVARAELQASYKPSRKTRYEARVARAEADYAVAMEKCDDKGGNVKDVCVKEAKAAETAAKADAKAKMKSSAADAMANEKSDQARSDANETANEAHKAATADKRDAQYQVAKEKCDKFAGAAKDQCLQHAKTSFGNP